MIYEFGAYVPNTLNEKQVI